MSAGKQKPSRSKPYMPSSMRSPLVVRSANNCRVASGQACSTRRSRGDGCRSRSGRLPPGKALQQVEQVILGELPVERLDARPGFAAPQHAPLLDIPGRQVLQRPAPLVLRFDAPAPFRPRLKGRMNAKAGLDAGLLVAAEDPVERVESLPLPVALVQV